MKIDLKPIVKQLTEAVGLEKGYAVSAMIDKDKDNDDKLVGWIIVKVQKDGTLLPQSNKKYKTIKEMLEAHEVSYSRKPHIQ